jgi:GntR family transcriptional regulator
MTGSAPDATEGTSARWRELTGDFALRSPAMPLHARISELLVDLIQGNDLTPGEQLPAERELAQMLGVSLAPVRQAILEVVSKGLLERRRGRGTFVRGPELDVKISILHSITQGIRAEHVEVETRVLRQQQVPMPREAARALAVRERTAFLLERVAIVGREPVALLQAYLSVRTYPKLIDSSFAHRSVYETLQEQYGTVVTKADNFIELARSTSAESGKLGIAVGEPLLKVEGTAFAQTGQPVEYFRVLYRSERVRFHVECHRESDRVVQLMRADDVARPAEPRLRPGTPQRRSAPEAEADTPPAVSTPARHSHRPRADDDHALRT